MESLDVGDLVVVVWQDAYEGPKILSSADFSPGVYCGFVVENSEHCLKTMRVANGGSDDQLDVTPYAFILHVQKFMSAVDIRARCLARVPERMLPVFSKFFDSWVAGDE